MQRHDTNPLDTTFVCSDPHFGHGPIMKHCARTVFMTPHDQELFLHARSDPSGSLMHQFRPSPESVRQMDDGLVANINARVGRDDILWCLGDWAMFPRNQKNKSISEYYTQCRAIRDRIRCQTIHFIWGNHDGHRRQRVIADLFAETYDQTQDYIGNAQVTFNHYPLVSWNAQHWGTVQSPNVCLYGHVHNKEATPRLLVFPQSWAALDCGFDSNEYQVWSMREAVDYLAPNLTALEALKKERGQFDPFRGRGRPSQVEV